MESHDRVLRLVVIAKKGAWVNAGSFEMDNQDLILFLGKNEIQHIAESCVVGWGSQWENVRTNLCW